MKFDILFYKFIVLRCEPYAGSAAEVEVGAEQSEFVNLETIAEVKRSFSHHSKYRKLWNGKLAKKKHINRSFFHPFCQKKKPDLTDFNEFEL